MFCEGCVLEIANAVIRRVPSDNESPKPWGGGISSRILSSIRSREGTGNTLVSRKKKINQLRFTPYYYTFKTLGLVAQTPLLSGALADVCGRHLQFVSSDYGAANEISVPAAPRPAGAELPHATKSHGLPFSPAAVAGLRRGRRGSPRQEEGQPWPGGASPPVGPDVRPELQSDLASSNCLHVVCCPWSECKGKPSDVFDRCVHCQCQNTVWTDSQTFHTCNTIRPKLQGQKYSSAKITDVCRDTLKICLLVHVMWFFPSVCCIAEECKS